MLYHRGGIMNMMPERLDHIAINQPEQARRVPHHSAPKPKMLVSAEGYVSRCILDGVP